MTTQNPTNAAGIPVVPPYRNFLAGRPSSTELYQEHRAQELARDDVAAALLSKLADAVAEDLGEDWKVWPGNADDVRRLSRRLDGPDNAQVFISWDDSDKFERLAVSAGFPEGTRAAYYGATSPRITVRADRGAQVLIRELRRRVLADYLVELDKANKAISSRNNEAAQVAELAAELAEVIGGEVRPQSDETRAGVHWYHPSPTITGTASGTAVVSLTGVRIDGAYLTVDQFRRIAAILAETNA